MEFISTTRTEGTEIDGDGIQLHGQHGGGWSPVEGIRGMVTGGWTTPRPIIIMHYNRRY